MTGDFEQVTSVLRVYFDGLHLSDSERLRRVFHPTALYACATGERLVRMDMDAYFRLVEQRPAPASRGDERTDHIDSIEFAGPVTALARVRCSIPPKHYVDLLTLVKVERQWRIIAKVFHYEYAMRGQAI